MKTKSVHINCVSCNNSNKYIFYRPDEVHSIIMGRLVLKYAGPEIDAMKSIAEASRKRSMADFQTVCIEFIFIIHFCIKNRTNFTVLYP